MPAVVVTGAAPAFAASTYVPKSVTVTADKWTQKSTTITIPAGSRKITYEVVGGGGGTYNGSAYSPGEGGSGAKITGTLANVCPNTALTLWAVAGGGGYGTAVSGQDPVRATGYGNGGQSKSVPSYGITAGQAWCSGGGAGSALGLGTTIGTQPLTVAGGGGAGGVVYNSNFNETGYVCDSHTSNDGGDAGGGSGSNLTATFKDTGTITGGGGAGATGATGGAGGKGSTTITGYTTVKTSTGGTGGNHGTGNLGGGNGADPTPSYVELAYLASVNLRIAAAAGGGGYAGGGSGGVCLVDKNNLVPGATVHRMAGVGGPGGAGSNYIAPTADCVTNTVTAQGQAGNGGISTGTAAQSTGGPGYVKVSWEQPS